MVLRGRLGFCRRSACAPPESSGRTHKVFFDLYFLDAIRVLSYPKMSYDAQRARLLCSGKFGEGAIAICPKDPVEQF